MKNKKIYFNRDKESRETHVGISCRGVLAISKHLSNILQTGELVEEVVVSKMEITTQHGAIEGKT